MDLSRLFCAAALFSAVLSTASCGVREVTLADGSTQRDLYFGAATPFECSNDKVVSAKKTFLGAWGGASEGAGIGYRSVKIACGQPNCAAVFWLPPGTDEAAFRKIARKYGDLCVIK